MAFYKTPDEMFIHRVNSYLKTYKEAKNKGDLKKMQKALEGIEDNFMRISKYSDEWKAKCSLDKNENYSELERKEAFEKFKKLYID